VKKFENESDAFAFEKKLILLYKLYNLKLCNLTDGGEGFSGLIFTEEHKNKISMANKGKRSWMKGKNHSKISKKKMSKAKKGKPAHENTKRALIKANTGKAGTMTGRSHSNKAKLKMSEKRKGHLNPASKKVILTTENRVFNTIKECADYLNVSNVTLSRHLNKSSLKYNVEYLNG
jgi:group I intron endonuclease